MNRQNIKEISFFGISGVAGYLVDVTITFLLRPYLGVYFGRIPAFLLAASTTWLVNRNLTFKERGNRHTSLWKEYVHYLSLMLLGAVANYTVYAVAITFLGGMQYSVLICVALGSLAGMMLNFFTSKRYIYSEKPQGKSGSGPLSESGRDKI